MKQILCALTHEQQVDPKDHPLVGIGEYFMKLGKPANAKHALEKALISPTATEIDKGNAKVLLKRTEGLLRGINEAKLDGGGVVNLPVKDLEPLKETEIPMGSQDYKRMLEDIRERGIQIPLVVNTENKIVCGKHRWQAAKEIGLQEVPCTLLGVTNIEELRYYALSDNLNRRQMGPKEKKAIITEILRLRKESKVRGRKKGGPRKEGGAPSNRKIAEVLHVNRETVDKMEKELAGFQPVSQKSPKPLRNFVKENFKKQISWGKSNEADKEFSTEVSESIKERIESIRTQAKKGQKLTVEVVFQYEDFIS